MSQTANSCIHDHAILTKKDTHVPWLMVSIFHQISLLITANKQTNKWNRKHFYLPKAIEKEPLASEKLVCTYYEGTD